MNSKLLVIAAASVFALAACERTAEGAREDTARNSAAAQKAAITKKYTPIPGFKSLSSFLFT